MQAWANLDLSLPLSRVAEEARRAERLGYDVLCIPDLVHDGIAAATLAVAATREIRVTWTALIAFARSPMTVAVAAWDLQALSGGRFAIGLGPQIRANIVDRFSTPWSPPAPRMREYVGSLRAIFETWQSRTPLRFEGQHYRFTRMQPYTSPAPIEHPEIPIRLAGIGPHMTALAGEVADGLHTHPTNACPRFLKEHVYPNVARGAARVGRDPSTLEIVANPLCATGAAASDVLRQREEQRQLLATLLSTPSYWPALELYGWRDRGERLHRLVREGRWDALAEVVDDEMLDVMVPSGVYPKLADQLVERYAGLVQAVTYPMPADPKDDEAVAHAVAAIRSRA
jgi:probable F420-dependent oxidoreductase